MNPFDFLNSINYDKTYLFGDPQAEKDYVPFLINKGLSYFHDTVFYANEMNRYNQIPKQWQYDFLFNSIIKKKRFSKWHKKDPSVDDLAAVKEYYKYSDEKAIEALSILTKEQVQQIKQKMDKGGNHDNRRDPL
jgi:hypothetical protein